MFFCLSLSFNTVFVLGITERNSKMGEGAVYVARSSKIDFRRLSEGHGQMRLQFENNPQHNV